MAQKYKMQGILKRISEVKQKPGQKFRIRYFIVDSGTSKHPNLVKFQLTGKYIDYADDRMINRKVEVEFYINGNATKKGYFTNLSATAILFTGS